MHLLATQKGTMSQKRAKERTDKATPESDALRSRNLVNTISFEGQNTCVREDSEGTTPVHKYKCDSHKSGMLLYRERFLPHKKKHATLPSLDSIENLLKRLFE